MITLGNDSPWFGVENVDGSTGRLNLYNGTSGGEIKLNEWAHVAAVVDGGGSVIYVNGVEVASQARTPTAKGEDLGIGHNNHDTPWIGNIDEVRVWNVARTQEEIQASMNSELS